MALAASRAPDIITRASIPLSATTDAPVLDAPRPPVSASNDPADLQSGVAKEITAQELAIAAAARKGDPSTSQMKEKAEEEAPEGNEDPGEDGADVTDEKATKRIQRAKTPFDFNDPAIADIPKDSPDWYRREVASIRRTERAKTEAAFKAAKAEMGDAAWDAAIEATRDKLVGEAKAEAARALRAAREAQEAIAAKDAELAELRGKVPLVEASEAQDPRPTRDKFDDPDEYDDALTAWGEREGERKVAAKVLADKAEADRLAAEKLEQDAREAHEAEVLSVKTAWETKVEAVKEKYDDFEEVVKRPTEEGGPMVTEAMTAGVMLCENGPEVAYHLGLNVDEARRIAELKTPARQLMAIAELSYQLRNPPRRARPPDPIVPIDNTGNTPSDTDTPSTMEEYAARRMPQLQMSRRPFFPGHA